jgi:serine protease Do
MDRAPQQLSCGTIRGFALRKWAGHIGNGRRWDNINKDEEKMTRALRNLTFICVGTVLGLFGGHFLPSYAQKDRPAPKMVIDDAPLQRNQGFTTSFAPVIKKAAPSVVNIFATRILKERDMRGMHPFFFDPRFREFFGEDEELPTRKQKAEALGSGVIVSDDGYILTCNHVIEGADEIKVEINGGREYTAKVIGADPPTDTAVLKVEATGLPAITLASSEKLEVGDVVLAIGNPFGIGQTVTMGIVSATGRGELGIMAYEDFIQTDASINMGNSGGALVDAQGRLIGVNSAIMSRTGGNQGVGFAIPITMARMVMERLIAEGKVTRGYLGVNLQPLDSELAARLGVKDRNGALITEVVEGTPAAEAGMRPGDLVVEYNGKQVNDYRTLRLMVSQTKPKTKTTFKVLREGKPKTFNVTLAELPTERTLSGFLRRGGEPSTPPEEETLEGVEVTDLDARSRRQFSVPGHVRGALVTNVDPDSTAFEKGLRPGDVILEIEQKPVTNADEAVTLSQEFKGKQVLLRVWSRGSTKYVLVDVNRIQEPREQDTPEQDRPRPNRQRRR